MLLQGLFGKLTEELASQAKEATEALIARNQVDAGQIGQAPAFCLVFLKELVKLIPPLPPACNQIWAIEIEQRDRVVRFVKILRRES